MNSYMTPDRRQALREGAVRLCRQGGGLTGPQIAQQLGCSKTLVHTLLREAGVALPPAASRRAALPPTKPCGCGDPGCIVVRLERDSPHHWARRKYANLTCQARSRRREAPLEAVAALRAKGLQQVEVAARLGLPLGRIARAYRLLGHQPAVRHRDKPKPAAVPPQRAPAPTVRPDYRHMNLPRLVRERIGDTGRWA